MTHFVEDIKACIARHGLIEDGGCVVVALSGGADSVALLSVLVSLGYRCVAAHCNFHLRGSESDRDCRHAAAVADSLGVKCVIKDFDVPAYEAAHGVSTEMACRELRYEWFEQVRVEYGAAAIAVAHHRDDNIETFFLNLLRGTGIAGLSGMSPRNGYVIRPMLDCTRADVEKYLGEQELGYVTDSTNRQNDFKRNRLRNLILPMIREQFPGADDAIASTVSLLRENEAVYREAINAKDACYRRGNRVDVKSLAANEKNAVTVLFEILRPFGFNATHAGDIIASAGVSGRRFRSRSHVALLNRGELVLSETDGDCAVAAEDEEYEIDMTGGVSHPVSLDVTIVDGCGSRHELTADSRTLILDGTVLDGNPRFVLRRWRKGDRLAPFGMKGTKKVSDIFSDAKLSLNEKSKVWLLTRNGEILWIVGMRASRHFPVTADSRCRVVVTCR